MSKTIIKRDKYLSNIKNFINKDIVKVIIGQRRVGKSYILLQIIDELKSNFKALDEEIIYINKEDIKWDKVQDYKDLYEEVKNFKYIFIDEIQDITYWEKAIRSLQSSGNHDIYITGSNSNLLSSELSTFLSGRYISFNIYPLNYKEFLEFHKLEANSENFLKYLKFGGLPYLTNLELEEEIVYSYLKDVVNTIILKDVVARNNIRNVDFYKKLINYISSETGSIFSAKSISDYLKSQNIKMSPNIVLNYLENSLNASFLNKVSRYDIKGKRIFEIKEKYYFTDIGIKNALIGGYSKIHISGILENVVFSNLVSNGWEVKVGELQDKEVDFVCEKQGKIMYIQVAYLLETNKTRDREFASLLAINDSWPKYVISMDHKASGNIEGILWLNIENFLLEMN
ncbi:MAG: ATP-binding protein [Candidatus Gracilibacteria bacterium]|nr:ATP-binding protein [Candidatus Gracilibacteria bacterium]MDD2908230.1 ATP-binding protein [Candidatus Gracilibacteria bacterium]